MQAPYFFYRPMACLAVSQLGTDVHKAAEREPLALVEFLIKMNEELFGFFSNLSLTLLSKSLTKDSLVHRVLINFNQKPTKV